MQSYLTVAGVVFVAILSLLYTPMGAAMLRGAATEQRRRLEESDWRVWIPIGAALLSLAWPITIVAVTAYLIRSDR